MSGSHPNPTPVPTDDQVLSAMLEQAHISIQQGKPAEALSLVLAAAHKQGGDEAVLNAINNARAHHGLTPHNAHAFRQVLQHHRHQQHQYAGPQPHYQTHEQPSSSSPLLHHHEGHPPPPPPPHHHHHLERSYSLTSASSCFSPSPSPSPSPPLADTRSSSSSFSPVSHSNPLPIPQRPPNGVSSITTGGGGGIIMSAFPPSPPSPIVPSSFHSQLLASSSSSSSSSSYTPFSPYSTSNRSPPGILGSASLAGEHSAYEMRHSKWADFDEERKAPSVHHDSGNDNDNDNDAIQVECTSHAPCSSSSSSSLSSMTSFDGLAAAAANSNSNSSEAILVSQGRGELLESALEHHDSTLCPLCNALIPKHRFQIHVNNWCQALHKASDVIDEDELEDFQYASPEKDWFS